MVKLVFQVRVKNQLGLHMRPAMAIVKLLEHCESDVSFTYKDKKVNAKSLLSLLLLAAGKNSTLTIEVNGEDANLTMEKLVEAFESQFPLPEGGDCIKKSDIDQPKP